MSIIPPNLSRDRPFYLSGPMPCPYLPAQVERKLFTRLSGGDAALNADINGALCRAGFRRSHDLIYRPACGACNACVPVRVAARVFQPSRSLMRVATRNRDLVWQRADPAAAGTELFALFRAYQTSRHGDGDMARMPANEFAAMLQDGQAGTRLYTLSAGDTMQGCMIADPVGDGLSAVYSFFAPDQPRRSLGSFLILSLIEQARAQDLPFVYLGYWIARSRKMAYKSRFKPLQFLGPHGWDWLV